MKHLDNIAEMNELFTRFNKYRSGDDQGQWNVLCNLMCTIGSGIINEKTRLKLTAILEKNSRKVLWVLSLFSKG